MPELEKDQERGIDMDSTPHSSNDASLDVEKERVEEPHEPRHHHDLDVQVQERGAKRGIRTDGVDNDEPVIRQAVR